MSTNKEEIKVLTKKPVSNNSFDVVVRKKIPYLTNFLYCVLLISVVILWLSYLFFMPVEDAPGEIQTAWYILVVPAFIKNALFYSTIVFLLVTPLWIKVRLYKNGILTFLPNEILLKGSSIHYSIPIDRIKKVSCMDATDADGYPKCKLTVYFLQKRKRQIKESIIRVRLKDYSQIDDFIEHLTKYENLDIQLYNMDMSPDPDKEI